ncbi:hypothetical protein L1987_73855 [Smallanthus sonchifolius]|uniref:Uncharacterized protein n=1 Tax=Smallanthus sonchifolius TaxID=185202 RepID=A0ACB9A1B6_9ASTR|nr:hypothetical protein L1987_73855 [Smallanthus sonchifolius]
MDKLHKRENMEIAKGGFGLGEHREQLVYEEVNDEIDDVELDEQDTAREKEYVKLPVIDSNNFQSLLSLLEYLQNSANEINIKYHNAIIEARKLCPESIELSDYIKKFNWLFKKGVEVEDASCGKELTAINSTDACFYTLVSVKKQTYESGIWTQYCIDVADAYEVFSAEREKEERHISRNIEIDYAPDMSIGLTQGGEKRCTILSATKENTMPNKGEDIFVDKWNVKKNELCMLRLSLCQ